jgi:hypothetical protein
VTVSVRSLDSFCEEFGIGTVDFIWADIQGAEGDLIAGGANALARTRYLMTEYCNEELYEGQPSLGVILQLLPGSWRILCCDGNDALLCNESYDGDSPEAYCGKTLRVRESPLCTDDAEKPTPFRQPIADSQDQTAKHRHGHSAPPWAFRIVMPTSNKYAERVVPISLKFLELYWPDHLDVDIIHFEQRPPLGNQLRGVAAGQQSEVTWTAALLRYLENDNQDDIVFLMLDDYCLCGPVARQSLLATQRAMLGDPRIANVHLSWLPISPKSDFGLLQSAPRWSYSVNTQAALWRCSALRDVAAHTIGCEIEAFELAGSTWFNQHGFEKYLHCQVAMPAPPKPSAFVDEMDKTHWALPYNNLMRRGRFDTRHSAFLERHGVSVPDV